MKRKELLKKSASLALAFCLVMQGVPAYAAVDNSDVVETQQTTDLSEETETTFVQETETVSTPAEEIPVMEENTETITNDSSEVLVSLEGSTGDELPDAQTETLEESESEKSEPEQSEPEQSEPEEALTEEDLASLTLSGAPKEENQNTVSVVSASDPADPSPTNPDKGNSKITDLTCGDVETNTDYQFISFLFGDEADHVYECYITGIQLVKDNADTLMKLAEVVANHFLSGDNTELKIKTGEGGIDAEKHSADNVEKGEANTSGFPYGDVELCWAATDSNMLEFAGWRGDFADEDALFTAFINGFFDEGSTERYGLNWFLNGIYPGQTVSKDGSVLFPDYMILDKNIMTQQRELYTGGYEKDYCAGNIAYDYSMQYYAPYSIELVEELKKGNAVGLSVRFLNEKGKDSGGHALTLFGYIKDTASNTMDALKAIFIADSDNDKGNEDKEVHKTGDETEEDRRGAVNSLTMEFLETTEKLGFLSYNMPAYDTYGSIIDLMTILTAKANLAESDIEKEGTKDPTHDPDMDFLGIELENMEVTTYYTGDVIPFKLYTKNMSYVGFDEADGPIIKFLVSVYSGDQLLGEVPYEVDASKFSAPLAFGTFLEKIYFEEAGTYTLKARIESIVDKNGNIIREAYTSNNSSETFLKLTILEKKPDPDPEPTPDPDPTPTPDPTPVDPDNEEGENIQTTGECNCYCTKFGFTCKCKECGTIILVENWLENVIQEEELHYLIKAVCNPLEIVLPVEETETLNVFLDGKYFCEELYTVDKDQDGSLVITLDGEIVRNIGTGMHDLVIETDDGFVYYHLNIV